MAKKTFWFKHFSNTSDNKFFIEFIDVFGMGGYGLYWIMIEKMVSNGGFLALSEFYRLAERYKYSMADEFISYCVEHDEIYIDNEFIKNENISFFIDNYISKRKATNTKRKEYSRQLCDKRWKEKRLRIIERDGFKCTECGNIKNLQVHHLSYIKGHKAWEYDDSNLVTLCQYCHMKKHNFI